ncbi:carbohydrate binding domain-containing protein [Fodinicola acaciae]|uniref:carbohydrate binding domain-containing protein n=1 Tax=Fodinicola acaciae TaxID=2681555 RepID=UPI0013D6197B|nr:carbohydrate binding domain-containing protein [Fodinicola acaciae]
MAHRKGRLALLMALLLAGMTASPPAVAEPAGDPIVAADGNIVANGGFDAGDPAGRPSRWILGAAPSLQSAKLSTTVHSGHASLQISDNATDNNITVRSEKRLATAGTTYAATAWVLGGSGTTAWFYLEFWDVTGARLIAVDKQPAFSTSWQKVQLSATAPAGTTHVTVAIYGAQATTGVSYYDDVSLVAQRAYDPRIGVNRELFVDGYRIDSMSDVGRVVHAGTTGKPVIKADRPWEKTVYIYGTVVQDASTYKMWYMCFSPAGTYNLCYATSADGITWTKPVLDIVDYDGSTANNIVLPGGGTVVYDPDATDANRRYKAMNYVAKPQGYDVYFSPDGLHWTASTANPVLPYGDVSNVAYDRVNHQFVATTKQRMFLSQTPGTNDRAAFVSTSKDFEHWTTPTLAVEGDAADTAAAVSHGSIETQIYGMPVIPYAGTYLGLPWRFEINNYADGPSGPGYGDGPVDVGIAASRDLTTWSSPDRDPVLPVGTPGSWNDGTIYTATTMQVTDNEFRLYYGGFNVGHGGGDDQRASIGIASWRRDGFVSLTNGGDDPGTVTTKPITVPSGGLHVNAKLQAGGSLSVEVLDASGAPVSGFEHGNPISGDQLSATVSWKSGSTIDSLAGKQVRLRFHLDGGDLYSYWFA